MNTLKRYDVWCLTSGQTSDDAARFTSTSPNKAVEAWALWEDQQADEFWIVGGGSATVCVREQGTSDTVTLVVTGERMPRYSAVEVPSLVKV